MFAINILHLSSNKGLIKGYKTVTSFDFTQHPYVGKSTPMVVWLHAKRVRMYLWCGTHSLVSRRKSSSS